MTVETGALSRCLGGGPERYVLRTRGFVWAQNRRSSADEQGIFTSRLRSVHDDMIEIHRGQKDDEVDGQTSFCTGYFYTSNVWMIREKT